MPISTSVVRLRFPLTVELVQTLIATRNQRDLDAVYSFIEEKSIAKALAELVSTDRRKLWTCIPSFIEESGAAFCTAVIGFHRKFGFSSLTALHIHAEPTDQAIVALLLSSVPTIQSFIGRFGLVRL